MGRPISGIGLAALLIIAAFIPRVACAQALDHYTLIMGWLPGQCLVNPELPLCEKLTLKASAGRNLTLIGLRPDPRTNSVPLQDCDPMTDAFTTPLFGGEVDTAATQSCHLPAVKLSDALAKSLAGVMPSTAQCAERRFWASHGSCSMLSQERYFQRAVDRAQDMQRSQINAAIAGAIGSRVKRDTLIDAFTQQFGEESAASLQLVCGRSKQRQMPVLTEIRLLLRQQGTMQTLYPAGFWREAGSSVRQGCPERFLVAAPGEPVPDPIARPEMPGTINLPQMPTIPAPQVPTIAAPTITVPTITAPQTPAPADPTKPQPMQTEPMEITPPLP